LAQKAIEEGYNPEIILAGRRMNDGMGAYVASEVIKLMIKKDAKVKNGNVLVMGVTFKENCPDIRNSKVIDVIDELKKFNLGVDVYDPWANEAEVSREFNIPLHSKEATLQENYDAIILAVSHQEFIDFDLSKYSATNAVVFDVKSFYPTHKTDSRL
jgi:UDP-N-acetyl-D-galactosamine dehydrogenase